MSNKSPEQQVFDVLEKVVTLENSFVDQQGSLVKLEEQEKEIYDKIIGLGMKEHDQLVELSDEAISLIEERKKHMKKERESIVASKQEFSTLPPIIKKIEKKELKKEANQLFKVMNQRYEAHDAMYDNYLAGLNLDTELYEMFKRKNLTLEELEDQIKQINETYEKVLEENEKFNEQTKRYNEVKLAFYQQAGIEIQDKKQS